MQSQGEASRPFSPSLLAENLKALNAKERDHLMRLAYLGRNEPYSDKVEGWLSPDMVELLRAKANLPGATCKFAGMDYHLDWVFAALKFSCEGISVGDVPKDARFRCEDGRQEDSHLSDDLADVSSGGKGDDPTLLPVSGRQEDVDLLVLFADGEKTTLLFIEAKGATRFDAHQLARKLIRLDRILKHSGAKALGEDRLKCDLVLVAPEQPTESCAYDIASGCKDLAELLEEESQAGVGKPPIKFIPLAGFPKSVAKVTRIPIPGQRDTYTHWKVAKR